MTKKKTSTTAVETAPAALLDSAKGRTTAVVQKLTKAMRAMEKDIEENDGLYPFNKGRVTQSEVCRRAGVSKVTLQGDSHKETTKLTVDDWVARVTAGVIKGKRNVRKTVTERADAWKEQLEAIAQQYHEEKLEVVDLRERVNLLEAECEALRVQLSAAKGKVAVLPRRTKNGEISPR